MKLRFRIKRVDNDKKFEQYIFMEQKSSRFLSEMVLAPSLGLQKKSVTMCGDALYIVMGFLIISL